jgi:hypothetical protein
MGALQSFLNFFLQWATLLTFHLKKEKFNIPQIEAFTTNMVLQC